MPECAEAGAGTDPKRAFCVGRARTAARRSDSHGRKAQERQAENEKKKTERIEGMMIKCGRAWVRVSGLDGEVAE